MTTGMYLYHPPSIESLILDTGYYTNGDGYTSTFSPGRSRLSSKESLTPESIDGEGHPY